MVNSTGNSTSTVGISSSCRRLGAHKVDASEKRLICDACSWGADRSAQLDRSGREQLDEPLSKVNMRSDLRVRRVDVY